MAEMNKKVLVAEIQHAMKKNRKLHQSMVEQLDEALKESDNVDAYLFGVKLQSLWNDQGEKDVNSPRNKDLEQGLRRSIQKFLRINNRSDIQARWEVTVRLPCGHVQQLPDKMWVPIAIPVLEDLDPKLAEHWRRKV